MRAIEGAAAPREVLAGPDLERIVLTPPPSPPDRGKGSARTKNSYDGASSHQPSRRRPQARYGHRRGIQHVTAARYRSYSAPKLRAKSASSDGRTTQFQIAEPSVA